MEVNRTRKSEEIKQNANKTLVYRLGQENNWRGKKKKAERRGEEGGR